MEILLSRAGLSFDGLSGVVLTGSFGAVLSPAVLKNVGIFSENMVRISGFVREGALCGVERMLVEPGGRERLESLAGSLKVLPLSGTPAFEKLFLANLNFPEAVFATETTEKAFSHGENRSKAFRHGDTEKGGENQNPEKGKI
jgi:uncharacterized 2Fe-2S/4Fe-4S cluster protein (DUF4445 family)